MSENLSRDRRSIITQAHSRTGFVMIALTTFVGTMWLLLGTRVHFSSRLVGFAFAFYAIKAAIPPHKMTALTGRGKKIRWQFVRIGITWLVGTSSFPAKRPLNTSQELVSVLTLFWVLVMTAGLVYRRQIERELAGVPPTGLIRMWHPRKQIVNRTVLRESAPFNVVTPLKKASMPDSIAATRQTPVSVSRNATFPHPESPSTKQESLAGAPSMLHPNDVVEPIASLSQSVARCGECSKPLIPNAPFCFECGAPL